LCGNILGGGGRSSVILFVLRWGMGHMLVSGMISGVGIGWSEGDYLLS
jgi:hypothetical protein